MTRASQAGFITFEGGEGSGKTTQIKRLYQLLTAAGKECVVTREPGGCASAEAIRNVLLTGAANKWNPVAETLLFQAARVEHVEEIIRPALRQGKIVLCDRFFDSTLVYQGIAKGLGVEYVRQLHRISLANFIPNLTLLFDIDPQMGLKRASRRGGDETRFENMDLSFHKDVRKGFLALAKSEPERFAVLDASQNVEKVEAAMLKVIYRHLPTISRLA